MNQSGIAADKLEGFVERRLSPERRKQTVAEHDKAPMVLL